MLKNVSILVCLTYLCSACGTQTRIVERPVPVEVPGPTQWIPIPAELLTLHQKSTVPPAITFGDAILLWSIDRAIIDTLNGALSAIGSLNEPEHD